ncbi:MAG: endonuclease/exonuclease/phosphatase family protein [Calditrichaeota bacterium]|nr:MAG: endonuclease/exonuclease/phosphatase family protein [Calditrichota bacterium]
MALRVIVSLILMLLLLGAVIYWITFHPDPVQEQPVVCRSEAPLLRPGRSLKVMTYNVQYMAGKKYVFFYELPGDRGPDDRPAPEVIAYTVGEVARIIREERPDVVLLQEVNDGAKRTDYRDQLALLLEELPEEYACHTSAFYWKAAFVPHPRILGSVGMKLSIVSRYRIDRAVRYQLPPAPNNILKRQFYFKRAVLEARLPLEGGGELAVLNTHLDAWSGGSDVKQRQVDFILGLVSRLDSAGVPWVLGGDFNLLPPGLTPEQLPDYLEPYYEKEGTLRELYARYPAVPPLAAVTGPEYRRWFTHFPNHPHISAPDRTIDYIFASRWIGNVQGYVRQHDTQEISDHLPVIMECRVPGLIGADRH